MNLVKEEIGKMNIGTENHPRQIHIQISGRTVRADFRFDISETICTQISTTRVTIFDPREVKGRGQNKNVCQR